MILPLNIMTLCVNSSPLIEVSRIAAAVVWGERIRWNVIREITIKRLRNLSCSLCFHIKIKLQRLIHSSPFFFKGSLTGPFGGFAEFQKVFHKPNIMIWLMK